MSDCVASSLRAGLEEARGWELRVAERTARSQALTAPPPPLHRRARRWRRCEPRGLTPALNKQLNARLHDALAPAEAGLAALGLGEADARSEVAALFAHIVGLLVLSHTGRIRMFHQEPAALFERYLASLLARAASPRAGPAQSGAAKRP